MSASPPLALSSCSSHAIQWFQDPADAEHAGCICCPSRWAYPPACVPACVLATGCHATRPDQRGNTVVPSFCIVCAFQQVFSSVETGFLSAGPLPVLPPTVLYLDSFFFFQPSCFTVLPILEWYAPIPKHQDAVLGTSWQEDLPLLCQRCFT